jgi:hypothetical protein
MQLEEEEEKAPVRSLEETDRVNDDISRLESKIESSDLSEERRDAAERNLEQIRVDVGRLHNADGGEKRKLKEAVQLRMKALHMQLEEEKAPVRSLDETDRVNGDISRLESKIESSDLSEERREAAEHNLEQIRVDVGRLQSADGGEKRKLKEAVQLRMKALHMQLEEEKAPVESTKEDEESAMEVEEDEEDDEVEKPSVSTATAEKIDSLLNHAEQMKEKLASLDLSGSERRVAEKDIAQLEEDAEEIRGGGLSAKRKANLIAAMKLRSKALREIVSVEA